MQLLSLADSSKLFSFTPNPWFLLLVWAPPGLGMRLVTVQFCTSSKDFTVLCGQDYSEHKGVKTGYLESQSWFHNLSMNSTAVDIVQARRKHFVSGTATGKGSVGSGDPSTRSVEKFFTFILQLSGLALVAPLSFALHCQGRT